MKAFASFLAAGACVLLSVSFSYGQDEQTENYRQLYKQGKYDEIINLKPAKAQELPAKALYYKGMAYYMKSEDTEALKYLDKAIEKGPADHDMFFYKGKLLYYADRFTESLPYFTKAISMRPNEPDFYAGKAEAFYELNKPDSALVYFSKASALPNCKPRVHLLMGAIYQDQQKNNLALEAFQTALPKLDSADESYSNCLFNIGLLYQLSGQPASAQEAFEKYLGIFPNDHHATAKLIQTFYALAQFEKAIPYKQQLYKAYEKKQLPGKMNDMFCFDQFIWNGRRVMAFERFAQPETADPMLFVKHRFYVLTEAGEIDYKIESESSMAIQMNGPNSKYVLCLVKGNAHFTYWQYVFNDDYQYPDLKNAVLDILNEKVKPAASFIPGKKG